MNLLRTAYCLVFASVVVGCIVQLSGVIMF